jgi:hypothetical protein
LYGVYFHKIHTGIHPLPLLHTVFYTTLTAALSASLIPDKIFVTAASTVSGQSGCFALNSALVVRGVVWQPTPTSKIVAKQMAANSLMREDT